MWEPSRLLSFKHQLLPRSLLQLPDHLQGKHPIWCLSNTPRETSLSSDVENTFVFLSLCLGSCVLCKQACLLMSLVLKKSNSAIPPWGMKMRGSVATFSAAVFPPEGWIQHHRLLSVCPSFHLVLFIQKALNEDIDQESVPPRKGLGTQSLQPGCLASHPSLRQSRTQDCPE